VPISLYCVELIIAEDFPQMNSQAIDLSHSYSSIITVPHSNLYAVINPIYLKVDFLTILWLNTFLLNLLKNAVSFAFQCTFVSANK
jgi:hypothetical protein